MKTLARILIVIHCLLALSMPAHALSKRLELPPQSRTQLASADHCPTSGMHTQSSATPAEEPSPERLSSHASCTDCLMCSSGCLPAHFAASGPQPHAAQAVQIARQPVLAIGLAPAPELKPPRR